MRLLLTTAIMLLVIVSTCWSGQNKATGDCYYDTRTNHKYVKMNGHYSEYTKAGVFFKEVDPSLPLLNDSKRVTLVTDRHFIIYHRKDNGRDLYKTKPALSPHLEGWKCKQLVK